MSRRLRSSQKSSQEPNTSITSTTTTTTDTHLVTIQKENIPSLKVTIKLSSSILKFISIQNDFTSLVRSSQTPTDLNDINVFKFGSPTMSETIHKENQKPVNRNNNRDEGENGKVVEQEPQEKKGEEDEEGEEGDEDEDEDDDDDDTVVIKHQNSIPRISKVVDEEDADEISEDPFSSDDELFLLESEINKALSSNVSITPTSKSNPSPSQTTKRTAPSQIQSSPLKQVKQAKQVIKQSPDLSAFKPVPSNIAPLLQNELNRLNSFDDSNSQSQNPDEIMVAEKLIFSLKDPLSATKIKLPVKSMSCIHFECFDFETFCLFNKIPCHIQNILKHDLSKKNFLQKKQQASNTNINRSTNSNPLSLPLPPQLLQQQFQLQPPSRIQPQFNQYRNLNNNTNSNDYVRVIENPIPQTAPFNNPNSFESYSNRIVHPHPQGFPFYHQPAPPPPPPNSQTHKPFKCPLCDIKFALPDLLISDSYNYFVKSTPKETERIELFESRLYRILDDSITGTSKRGSSEMVEEEVIVLSDDDEEEDLSTQADKKPSKQHSTKKAKDKKIQEQPNVKNERGTSQNFNDDIPLKDLYSSNFSTDELDDGLDEELLSIGMGIFTAYRQNYSSRNNHNNNNKNNNNNNKRNNGYSAGKGMGSWEDPVTLD